MEQNIVQNIASVPTEGTPGFKCGCRGDDLPLSIPESEDRINRLAVDYATAMEKENGITQYKTSLPYRVLQIGVII